MNNETSKEKMLVYPLSKIQQIAQCLGNVDIRGVANIKNMSVALALLEMPEKTLEDKVVEEKPE